VDFTGWEMIFTNGRWALFLQNARWVLIRNGVWIQWRHGLKSETHIGDILEETSGWCLYWFWCTLQEVRKEWVEKIFWTRTKTTDKVSQGPYTQPLLIMSASCIMMGMFVFQLMRRYSVSKRIRGTFMVNTDKEYMAGLIYLGKYWFHKRIMIWYGIGFWST
jgi:hypothetical protein